MSPEVKKWTVGSLAVWGASTLAVLWIIGVASLVDRFSTSGEPAGQMVAVQEDEDYSEWITFENVRYKPSFTEGDCSVSCGKTEDDILISVGRKCGFERMQKLCEESWERQDPMRAQKPEEEPPGALTLLPSPLLQTCIPGYHEEAGEEPGTGLLARGFFSWSGIDRESYCRIKRRKCQSAASVSKLDTPGVSRII